jgi:8-oxo-dGTP pyrophosphatase MutT (NUDIX family)
MKSKWILEPKAIERALQLDHPYPYPRPKLGTPCGVLMLISLSNQKTVLIKRPIVPGDPHSGQISFPGGRIEDQDHDPLEDIRNQKAALREFEEETGFSKKEIQIAGSLPDISTPSGYRIFPVIGLTKHSLDESIFHPDPCEVEHLILPDLLHFFKPSHLRIEMRSYSATQNPFPVYFYQYKGHEIWGVTAAILHNFVERIKRVLG